MDNTINNLNVKNGRLKKITERIVEGKKPLLLGPETVVFSEEDDSSIYTFTKEGKIIRLHNFVESAGGIIYADTVEIASSVGCPLGGKFMPGSQVLYFADAVLGLCRIDVSKKFPKIELVASKATEKDGRVTPILYADDVDIGPKSGMVYFSDASDIPPYRNPDHTFDVLYSYKMDFLRNKASGRLIRYNPNTEKVDVLADGIAFANGVAVDESERFVLISETSRFRVLKYHLVGPKQGEVEVMVDSLVGHVDGVDCSSNSSGLCYIAIPTCVSSIVKILFKMPNNIEAIVRTMIMMLPKSFVPSPDNFTGVLEIDSKQGIARRMIQDPNGEDVKMITGVTVHGKKLYLGSLHNDFIGVYDLY